VESGFEIGRIAGVRVSLHWSLLVIWWLLTWSLATVLLPEGVGGQPEVLYWITAGLTAIGLLACVLVHELSHAIVARHHGVETDAITLWVLGGVAQLREESPSPRAELAISGVGPVTSLALAAAIWSSSLVFDTLGLALVATALGWLALVNVVLAVFNLLPGLPLDGGRVLHALLWRRTGDRARATQATATAGRSLGYGLIAFGVLQFSAGYWNGVWLAFVGWFLVSAASAEASTDRLRGALGDLRVRDVMTDHPDVAPDWISVEDLLDHHVLRLRHSTFPVHDAAGRLTGLVTLARIKTLPPDRRRSVPVAAIAAPIAEVTTAEPGERFFDLLPRLASGGDRRALVLDAPLADGGRLVGIITPTDVARAIELASMTSPV
jgi:Zn-dependent protease/CBS domain-containing protein